MEIVGTLEFYIFTISPYACGFSACTPMVRGQLSSPIGVLCWVGRGAGDGHMKYIITDSMHWESPFRPGIPHCTPRYPQGLRLGCHHPTHQPHGQHSWYRLDQTCLEERLVMVLW